jgi:FkbH-like protein
MTIALLSNVNVTSLAMRARSITKEEVYCPHGYNTWLQELSDPGSKLYSSGAGAVFVTLHGSALLGDAGTSNDEAYRSALGPMAATIAEAAGTHRDMAFVVSSLDIPSTVIRPLVSQSSQAHAAAFWRRSIEDIPLPMLDLSEIAANMGRRRFYNARVWYMGGMPFSKQGEEAIASEMDAIWRALRGERKKCLALDLDNTLWGGVIGELGSDGIHLDKVGSGARFYDFQKKILELKRLGVLLVVLSKNNMVDAMNGMDNHPDMALRSRDFAAIMANWNPKPQNLRAAAKSLNIGVDSFVFIDDNPIEREMMRIELPEVAVPEFPDDSSQLEAFIIDVAHRYFLQAKNTDEDARKTEQYEAEASRRKEAGAYKNPDDYLRSLGMVLSVEGLNESNILRASQLTQKTNQFNVTTRRYSEAEMRSVANASGVRAYIGELRDRYGNYGKVILAIANVTGHRATIDTFLMSCRVMERGVETAFIRLVEEDLHVNGVNTVHAKYVPSEKNAPAADFWPRAGYKETGATQGGAEYVNAIPCGLPLGDLIKVETTWTRPRNS